MDDGERGGLYLLKTGEIFLKGQNRDLFERRLAANIKEKLKGFKPSVSMKKGRFYLRTGAPSDEVIKALGSVFGLEGFAEVSACGKTREELVACATDVSRASFRDDGGTFKVDARREDKKFALGSYEIECLVADRIHGMFPSLKARMKNSDYTLHVEVRDRIYVYADCAPGISGLPVGTAGKALSLLSGGIDSPVAAYLMASRGLRQELVYFHAYPYTGEEALEKVKSLAGILAPYLCGTLLHVVNFTPMEMRIKEKSCEKDKTLMLRAAMMRTAALIAKRRRCSALVTGEALSQVASQTLNAMAFTTEASGALVLRPLVGMNKESIIRVARSIGTYETSVLPYADCCVLFSPKHPVTNPDVSEEREKYFSMKAEDLEAEAADMAEAVCFDTLGRVREPSADGD